MLLLIFFTGIGLNARIADLRKGGRPLVILIGLTAILLVLQNVVGGLGAWLAGLPMGFGVALGSTSLLGGHGTMIAWSAELERLRPRPARRRSASRWRPSASSPARVIGGPLGQAADRARAASPPTSPTRSTRSACPTTRAPGA